MKELFRTEGGIIAGVRQTISETSGEEGRGRKGGYT